MSTQREERPRRSAPSAPSPAAVPDQTGRVKWFDDDKGYGFIIPDNYGLTGGRDVFVHHTSILMRGRRTLLEEQRVIFMLDFNERGPVALGVTLS